MISQRLIPSLVLLLLFFFKLEAQKLASTLAEGNSSFTYIPIDPLPVSQMKGDSCPKESCDKCATSDT